MLYAGDLRWWLTYGAEVERSFKGERWSICGHDGVNRIEGIEESGLSLNPKRIHTGGNSGYQALGLAYHWGVSKIVLLGYDMQRGPKGETHHHGNHGHNLPDPSVRILGEWAQRFVQLGSDLRERGVEVVNATRRTAITCFEQMSVQDALPIPKPYELAVLCVLRSGGEYTAEYVRKLRDAVKRNLTLPHRFVCLSDVPVPCERIPLEHKWPGWWSKIEIFRPGVITGPTLYLDLDTCITGSLDPVVKIPHEFAMLSIRDRGQKTGDSGVMWIGKPQPHVYERFSARPEHWMALYKTSQGDTKAFGDQGYISDQFSYIPKLNHWRPDFFKSYRLDGCQYGVPSGCSVVCFGGAHRPHNSGGWVKEAWV